MMQGKSPFLQPRSAVSDSTFPTPVYTVSQLTAEIRGTLEQTFGSIWVEGEISNFHHHSSGHMYFTLKDAESQIRAVMFRSSNTLLRFIPEDGLAVLMQGTLTVYERRGEYQIVVERMEPQGLGALQLAFEQLKERLEKEGLFDPAHKRPIPVLPRRIGVITSPTGAVIRDILNVLTRRFATVDVLLYPVAVQGDRAVPEIVEALATVNQRDDIDVLILARGGGSLEDLWAFNEEEVARAIFASRIPVISAVGHEVDFTIADFVADLRAPTPSAAAELVISRKDELTQRVDDLADRLAACFTFQLRTLRSRCDGLQRHLTLVSPSEQIRARREHLLHLWGAFTRRIGHSLSLLQGELKAWAGKLDSLSPLAILGRGYSICRRPVTGEIVKVARTVSAGEGLEILVHEGEILCDVREVR